MLIQDGSYPGTGKFDEIGIGAGEGATLNLPVPGGSGDTAMRTVFDEVIVPCAQRFKPDIILVSAGYALNHSRMFGQKMNPESIGSGLGLGCKWDNLFVYYILEKIMS